MNKKPEAGDTINYSRHILREDIIEFAKISNDYGVHHVKGDRLLAHGLLVATLPTKLGGDLNFIATEMIFEFKKGVYENDYITCTGRIDKVIEQQKRSKVWFSFVCINDFNETVLKGRSHGFIWK